MMKATVKTAEGPGNVARVDMPVPEPKPGEVRIRVEAAGICGTDCKIYAGDTWSNPPVILGHEYSGSVDALGAGVTGISVGDRVVSETAQVVCGDCEYCRTGRYLMCKDRLSIGYGVNGAFARYITVRTSLLHRIPDNVGFEEAALCEPFAVALHGVWDNAEILPTHTVLVSGPGAIGVLASIAAKSKGATVVLAGVESDAERLNIAKEIGIDRVTDRLDSAALRELTGKDAVDVAIDCTGAAPAIDTALHLLKANGKLVQIGLTKKRVEIEYSLLT
ncbi:MAG: alcohol dehydrogenase catalytic domain-containing protein, partial [Clostridiales Family XIII bacterium]|nr:alcohol dehydrogenase catalytic domain-containing protein [Clostridiales Family XIII bacterium]